MILQRLGAPITSLEFWIKNLRFGPAIPNGAWAFLNLQISWKRASLFLLNTEGDSRVTKLASSFIGNRNC